MNYQFSQAQPNTQHNYRKTHQPPRCANCDIEILWSPTVVDGKTFCCAGCASVGPCSCDYSQYRSVTISGVIHYIDVNERHNENERSSG